MSKKERTKKIKQVKSNGKRKERLSTNPAKLPKNAKIVLSILLVILLVLCYINMGLIFTIVTIVAIAIIMGVAKLLDKVKNNKRQRRIVNFLLILILTFGILLLLLFAAFLVYVTIKAPEFNKKELNTKESTIIYDKDGNEIIKLGTEMRDKVSYDELPQVLVDAIIATEDSRFYQHNGLDAPRFLRATIGQLTGHSDAGGASTLSMQVIKNTFTSSVSGGIQGIIRKFTDIYLAVFKLEKNYSKEQIIEFYVNNHFLGGNIYGVQEASQEYFGKDVSDLNLSEASILAGMFKSPNLYRPTVNPDEASKRRDTVLYLMKRHGYITDEEYKMAKSIPVSSLTAEVSKASTSPYQGYIDTVVEEISNRYGVNAYTTPLLIYSNMDRSKQNGVNDVMDGKTYTWINDKIQSAVSVLDSQTGKILAIGNGRNRSGDGVNSFNYATQMKRQPGSTAKPLFDYGPGIEYNNWSTYTLFDDSPYQYSDGTPINNWDRGYFGTVTLRRGLSTSRNIPALKAFQQVDKKKILDFVTNLGIQPEVCSSGYEYDPEEKECVNTKDESDTKEPTTLHEAHAIGAFTGVSPLQMSAAYAAFSNGGYYNEPYSVSKIVYRDTGKTEEFKQKPKKVMSDATAYMISSVLQDVSITGGKPNNVAAKTGTTNYDAETMKNNNMPSDAIRDSWVIGYTTKTVIGMWYGYNYIDKTGEYVSRNIPATLQKDRLFLALANGVFEKNKEEFKMPNSVVKLGIIAGSNPPQVAKDGYSGSVVYEYFKKGHEPDGSDAVNTKLATPTGLKVATNGNRVTISWNKVNRLEKDENYGTFGYNVYQGNTLLTFTENTSYTFNTQSPYGTYKVIATYKSYSGAQSDAASYTLKETAIKAGISCSDLERYKVGDPLPTGNNINCNATINGTVMEDISVTVRDSSNCGTGVFKDATSCTITYQFTYNGTTYTNSNDPSVYYIQPAEYTPEESGP